ncbi:MAG TPA: VOC family protein [Actinomycetota bacterium]
MLSERHVHPTIPASDMDRAKAFYRDKLGFEPKSEGPGGLIYEAGDGSWFLVYPGQAGTAPHTLAGWTVPDIEAEVAELRARGVVFEEYPNMPMEDGIATLPAVRSAWFKDSEGNILGLVQFLQS